MRKDILQESVLHDFCCHKYVIHYLYIVSRYVFLFLGIMSSIVRQHELECSVEDRAGVRNSSSLQKQKFMYVYISCYMLIFSKRT